MLHFSPVATMSWLQQRANFYYEFFDTVCVKCYFTLCKSKKSLLRPLYRKISCDTRAKDDSTLVWLSPSLRSGGKPYPCARVNTFALVSNILLHNGLPLIFAISIHLSDAHDCFYAVTNITITTSPIEECLDYHLYRSLMQLA